MRTVPLGAAVELQWGHEALYRVGENAKSDLVFGTHAGGPTGGFGGARYGATKRCTGLVRMPNWVCGTHADGGTGAFGRAPYGATKRGRGVPNCVSRTHVGGGTGAFGGVPYGAMKRCTGW
eukprot:7531530-Pyramimonas_sp.AAC.2